MGSTLQDIKKLNDPEIPYASYGPYRVRIRQGLKREIDYCYFGKGRGHFFLHGGTSVGTDGCIEIADYSKEQEKEKDFFKWLARQKEKIKLDVKYEVDNWNPKEEGYYEKSHK